MGKYDEKQVAARKLTWFAYVWEGSISCSCMVQLINFLFCGGMCSGDSFEVCTSLEIII